MDKPNQKRVNRNTTRKNNAATYDMIRRHSVQLSEHLSSVQINGTILMPDGTTSMFSYGLGDLTARVKMSELWVRATGL